MKGAIPGPTVLRSSSTSHRILLILAQSWGNGNTAKVLREVRNEEERTLVDRATGFQKKGRREIEEAWRRKLRVWSHYYQEIQVLQGPKHPFTFCARSRGLSSMLPL